MRVYLFILLFLTVTAFAVEDKGAKLHQGPQMISKFKEFMRESGLSEEFINKLPADIISSSSVHFHKDDLKSLSNFAESLCKAFKGSEITFYLGLDDKGELGIAMYPLNSGIEIKMDC